MAKLAPAIFSRIMELVRDEDHVVLGVSGTSVKLGFF